MPADASLADLLVRFEEEALAGLSPLTVTKRQGTLLRFARWLEPRSLGLLEAMSGDIEAWFAELGVADRTRRSHVAVLHRFYNWALNAGLVDRDPAAPMIHVRRPVDAGDFPELARGWWIAQERRSLAPSTIQSRACALRLLFDWLAPKSIVDATARDIELWLDGRRLGPKARYRAISDLHMFFRWARREGLVADDPTESIDRPRLPVGVPRPISDKHLAEAVTAAGPQVRAMLLLGALAGLRAKEIAGLRRADVLDHLDPPMIVVTAPKGHRERTVPLHPEVWKALDRYGMPRDGYLFAYPSGRPWPSWKVSQVANDHLHALQIPSSLHKLRHAFATKVYGASLDLRLTQSLLGHSSPTTTAVYTAYARGKASEVVAQLAVPAAE